MTSVLRRVAQQFAERSLESWILSFILAMYAWLFAPKSADLAAAVFRANLVTEHGFLIYSTQWYGGHHLLGYSVLSPLLSALLGPRFLCALATVASVIFFERIVWREFGPKARVGSMWFALTAFTNQVEARVAFAVGTTFGLASMFSSQRARPAIAAVLALGCAISSPVAGVFLVLAYASWMLISPQLSTLVTITATVIPMAVLIWLFPEGGTYQFPWQIYYPVLVFAFAAIVLLPAYPLIRVGAFLFAVLGTLAYLFPSPLGANVVRLGLLFGGPVLACGLWTLQRRVLIAAAPLLVLWTLIPFVRDIPIWGGASSQAAFYQPVLSFMSQHTRPPQRLEVVPTADHWESVYVPRHLEIARGWERQLDIYYNPLFYNGLTPTSYYQWLKNNAVSYVALSDAPLDYAGVDEALLLAQATPSYLSQVARTTHWRIFAVSRSPQILTGPGQLISIGPQSFTVFVQRPGDFLVRLHYSPYWKLASNSGCVAPDQSGWTRLTVAHPGLARIEMGFSLARRINPMNPRCR